MLASSLAKFVSNSISQVSPGTQVKRFNLFQHQSDVAGIIVDVQRKSWTLIRLILAFGIAV